MSRNIHGPLLQRRRYSAELQHAFADLSGDHNPMHVDPVAARRTLIGGLAVHGIHQTVAAMEALFTWFDRKGKGDPSIAGLKAQFLKPVLVGNVVALHLTKLSDQSCLITHRIEGEVVGRISIQFGPALPADTSSLPLLLREPVVELTFEQLSSQSGDLPLGLDAALAHKMFPKTCALLGAKRFAATLALSRLIGMRCPGLHSIFAEAAIRFEATDDAPALHFRTLETDARFSHALLAVEGSLQGRLTTFFRPPPQLQPGISEVKKSVKNELYSGSTALIVGGSRGLGEITAKIIAAGGGLPIITYHQGAGEAARIVEDIRAQGGRCEMVQMDVQNIPRALRQLGKTAKSLRTLYYFATPKIPGRQRGFFNHDMLAQFNAVYVTAFGRLIDAVAEAVPDKIRVFYPSSVMVTEGMEKMEEYIMAKRLAEEMCAFYNKHSKKIEIIVERLPRLKTDQTRSIIPLPAGDTLEFMLPRVSRVEAS
jgi:acyl dehydratase